MITKIMDFFIFYELFNDCFRNPIMDRLISNENITLIIFRIHIKMRKKYIVKKITIKNRANAPLIDFF